MSARITPALILAAIMILLFTAIVAQRNGLVFWTALVVTVAWAGKILVRPGSRDLAVIIRIGALTAMSWGGITAWVFSTWESVDVVTVEVPLDGPLNGEVQTVRTWIMDGHDQPWIIYDADAHVAEALLAGTTISVTRNGLTTPYAVNVSLYEEMTPEETEPLLAEYLAKYGEVDFINNVFYGLLGRKRGREVLILQLQTPIKRQ